MKNAPWPGIPTAVLSLLLLIAGCGLAGNPEPPTLALPQPPKNLTAVRVAREVHLAWAMPKDSTDKLPLKGDQRAHACWMALPEPAASTPPPYNAKACAAAGDGLFTPGKPAALTISLATELTAGPPRALAFYIVLQNHAGKTAGPSNPALVASGAAPPAVEHLTAQARADGIVLHWEPASQGAQPGLVLRIHRDLVPEPGAKKTADRLPAESYPAENHSAENQGAPPPEQQVLEVEMDRSDPGQAIDRDAVLDHTWKYWAERVRRVDPSSHALEIAGPPSATITIVARDVFPPSVPAGLAAVPDEDARTINLSWAPDTESDLAGYIVYRRDLTAGGTWTRISGKAPNVPPSYADKDVTSGHNYAYAVTAIDQDGNESARSPEVEEALPQ